jgi:formylglycine-generating enzyme required for sulfatase activity
MVKRAQRGKAMKKALLCAIALLAGAVYFGGTCWAQPPQGLPEFVQENVNQVQSPGGEPMISMMVTNADFAKFKSAHVFTREQSFAPAVMTEQEARDYATWMHREMGVDFVWRKLPKSTERGVLINLATGVMLEVTSTGEAGPQVPEAMVYVPEGTFTMGSEKGDEDEAPQHEASAGPFYIDKYEVGNAEFKAQFPEFQYPEGQDNHPAVVTWDQASAFAAKVGKRLPTEAEWEKAARGTDGRTFPWGESYDPSFVVWDENDPRGAAPACPASPFGGIDMAGGVWEWTSDWYQPYPGNDAEKEEYGEKFKVIRGGASFNDLAMCRTTHRYYLPPDTTGHLRVGFRCVQNVK